MLPWERSEERPLEWAYRVFWSRPCMSMDCFVRSIQRLPDTKDLKYEMRDIYQSIRYHLFYIPRNTTWLWQRMSRGWAECDTWEMHFYMTEVVLGMLKHHKKHRMGSPSILEEGEEPWDVPYDNIHKRWDKVLDQMIEGFEAKTELEKNDYLYWDRNAPDYLSDKGRELTGKWNKATQLYVKWYDALWD